MYGTDLYLAVLIVASLLALPAHAELSGLALEQDLQHDKAVIQYQVEITAAEESLGAYDFSLFEPLMGLARSQFEIQDYDGAIESIHRAQHVSHRHGGVHTPVQIEGIDLLTNIYLAKGEPIQADQQQRFAYYVNTHAAEPDSLEMLPAIDKLATWYAETGQLQRARRLTEQAIEIVEQHFGEGTLEQLPYLKQLAKLKRLQRVCCSTRVMQQALELVESGDVDDKLKVSTYLDIADTYTIAGDEDEAIIYYGKAWSLMSPADRVEEFSAPKKIAFSQALNNGRTNEARILRIETDMFGRQELRQISRQDLLTEDSLPPQEFFVTDDDSNVNVRIRDRTVSQDYPQDPAMRTTGKPIKFLHKQLLQVLPSRFHSDAMLSEIEVELIFDIDAEGRTQNIKTITGAAPTKLQRLMREVVRKTRFRPRMEDGMLVATENYRLIQKFPI